MNQIPCEIYDRVVGYYRPRDQTNAGKHAEICDRKKIFLKYSIDVKKCEGKK